MTGIIKSEKNPDERAKLSPSIVNIMAEEDENLSCYLKSIGLSEETDLIILSSNHHYYYEQNEINRVSTLINHMRLNSIKDLDTFIYTLSCTLPQNANFIGYFSDSKTLKGNAFSFYQPSRLFYRLINYLDSRTDHNLDKNKLSEVLERNRLRIIDMTDIN